MIGRLGRALLALVRGRLPTPTPRPDPEPDRVQAERLDAARQRLKETIPPPQED